MNRALKLVAVLIAVAIWGFASHAASAGTLADHGSALDLPNTVYIGASWIPQISITRSALRELRERMARYEYRTGVCIMGPMENDCRAPSSVEEAWLLEKLYGPPQRWVFDIVPLEDLSAPSVDAGERYCVTQVHDIPVGILSSRTVSRLSMELHGDAIRVYEVDA